IAAGPDTLDAEASGGLELLKQTLGGHRRGMEPLRETIEVMHCDRRQRPRMRQATSELAPCVIQVRKQLPGSRENRAGSGVEIFVKRDIYSVEQRSIAGRRDCGVCRGQEDPCSVEVKPDLFPSGQGADFLHLVEIEQLTLLAPNWRFDLDRANRS